MESGQLSSGQLCIHLLGHLRITYEGVSVANLQTDRYQSLVAYLVLKAKTPQPRSLVADLFWPNLTETDAKTNLRRELYRLRQVLPAADQFLKVTARTIQWQPQLPCWLDVAEFEIALAQVTQYEANPQNQIEPLKHALELYQGELLPTCYDDWIGPERDRLYQLMVQGLTELIQCLVTLGEVRDAISYCQQLLQFEPLSESGYLTLMQLYLQQGDRTSALQSYHQCMTQLREELGIDPNTEMQTLYQKLIAEQDLTITPPTHTTSTLIAGQVARQPRKLSPQTPFVGRSREWQVMQTWLSTTSSNLLLLEGEPGIGKTRLLEEFAGIVEAQGGTFLWGQGFAAETLRPYGAWIDALRSVKLASADLPEEIGVLLPEWSQTEITVQDRGRLFDAVITLIARMAEQQPPLMIIFDDIHWLDEASIALLHYGLRILRGTSVQFACSARRQNLLGHSAIATLHQTLQREDRLLDLPLSPLTATDILELITYNTSDSTPAARASQVYADSGGNPLLAIAVAQTPFQDVGDSRNLSSLVQERLQGLPKTAQKLLPWAAALGHSFDPMLLLEIADSSLNQLLTDLENLETANILHPSHQAERYEFVHDLMRQAIYQGLSAPRQRLMHRQIAEYLEKFYENHTAKMVEVVHHAVLANHDALVTKAALMAAQHSLTLFAFGEAAELAQQGLAHCAQLELQSRVAQQLPLLKVRVLAGVSPDDFSDVEHQIKVGIREAQALDLHAVEVIGQEALLILQYDHDQLEEVHQQSLAAAERAKEVHPSASAQLLAYSGGCLAILTRDMDRAEAMLVEAQTLAHRTGIQLSDVYLGLGTVYRYRGQIQQAETSLYTALEISQTKQEHSQSCQVLVELAMLAVEQDQWDLAMDHCHSLLPLADKLVGGSESAFGQALLALSHYALTDGDFENQVTVAIQALINLDSQRKLAFVLSHLARVALQHNQPQSAIVQATKALAAAEVVGNPNDVALAKYALLQSQVRAGELIDYPQAQIQIQTTLDEQSLSAWVVQKLTQLQESLILTTM
ncbi:BTAD domain-containing putative transcriptional regulator [Acaryochloris sp. CCMEE 5410]|uniref:BTAD domain-containing putative transcriptional regulator n=1 Tax=Acaryochloris sp. CCMEE 5410 TaxID=310037 RepID=UPI00024848CA|nr:BTAD domain-containing putative transcriptional regulator [Acaryochloris sp. CCMEE 5410]KAI9129825.1 AAA family ATPase [Acaryochloris sp. CCMEE 5410]